MNVFHISSPKNTLIMMLILGHLVTLGFFIATESTKAEDMPPRADGVPPDLTTRKLFLVDSQNQVIGWIGEGDPGLCELRMNKGKSGISAIIIDDNTTGFYLSSGGGQGIKLLTEKYQDTIEISSSVRGDGVSITRAKDTGQVDIKLAWKKGEPSSIILRSSPIQKEIALSWALPGQKPLFKIGIQNDSPYLALADSSVRFIPQVDPETGNLIFKRKVIADGKSNPLDILRREKQFDR